MHGRSRSDVSVYGKWADVLSKLDIESMRQWVRYSELAETLQFGESVGTLQFDSFCVAK